MRRRLTWLTVYTVAMAYLESAVVVYLRAIYYPEGFSFPLVLIDPGIVSIEVGREAATLVMLLGLTRLMSTDRWEWFLTFSLSFGIWDIFYYIWLWVFVDWPPSLFTLDILFLIPVPWTGPVLAPVIVSTGLVVGSLLLLRMKHQGTQLRFAPTLWCLAVIGGVLVLLSFTLDFRFVMSQIEPPPFHWKLFGAGVTCGAAALALGLPLLAKGGARATR